MSKQAMPLHITLIRQTIETKLVGISELLPKGYKITFVAVTSRPNQEIILTENNLQDIAELLLEHAKAQPQKEES